MELDNEKKEVLPRFKESINETQESIKFERNTQNWYLICWILVLSLGDFQFGYSMGELSIPYLKIAEYFDFDYTPINLAYIVAMVPIGAVIGAFTSGPLSYYGRRKCIIFSNLAIILGAIFCIIPNSMWQLFVGRFLIGIACGNLTSIIPMFILEISPLNKKGMHGTICQFAITSGVSISYSIGPKYYVIKTQFENANKVITKIKNYSVLNINESESAGPQFNTKDYDWNFNGRNFKSLLKPKYKRAFIVGFIISIFHQLTGIDLIVLYIGLISPFPEKDNYLTFAVVVTESILTTTLLIWLLKKIGRKQLMLIGQLLLCGCNCLLFHTINDLNLNPETNYDYFVKYFIVTLIFIFLFSFTIAIGPICWIFLAEIMTEVGMGIAVSANWIVIVAISLYPIYGKCIEKEVPTPDYNCQKDFSILFFIFCGSCILAFFLISLFVKETKDMTPFEIMKLYCEVDYDAITDE